MAIKPYIENIKQAIDTGSHPTVKLWNRLEARPRTNNFDRALKAEIKDALWMLSKQWQMGEFQGDDAASPVTAKIHIATTRLTKFTYRNHPVESFTNEMPLETKVEQQKISLSWKGQQMRMDIRLQLGRRWLKLISTGILNGFVTDYKKKYAFVLPPEDKAGDYIYAHKASWQQLTAVAGERCMDGGKLYAWMKANPANSAADGIVMTPAETAEADKLAKEWIEWFETELYDQPDQDAWDPAYLEYQCAASAPSAGQEKILTADEYYSGHLDWYSFDIDNKKQTLGETEPLPKPVEETFTRTFLPVSISFDGMPNKRWWTFEDSKTNFGAVRPSAADIGKLMLIEFGLVYANDWFILPFKLPVGSIANIKGMTVTNTFGERLWIEAAGKGPDDAWQRWAVFTMNIKGVDPHQQADTSLLLLNTLPKVQESEPVEEVVCIRDEMANMVWAIETRVPLLNGFAKPGKEVADETLAYHKRLVQTAGPVAPEPYKADISYLAMTSVPENWIPFIPVHIKDSNREVQLQRGAMLRIIEGDPTPLPPKIQPQTSMMRFGLDGVKAPYYVHEEEILRAGIRLTQSFQRTRWNNGKVFVWLGMRKETGRGEGSSELAFDQIINRKKEE